MLAPEPLTQRAATVRERPAAFEWAGRSLTVAARDAIRSSARIKWNPYKASLTIDESADVESYLRL